MITTLMFATLVTFNTGTNWWDYLDQLDEAVIKVCEERGSIYQEMCREEITECTLDDGDFEWCIEDYFNTTEEDVSKINRFCNANFMGPSYGCEDNIMTCYENSRNLSQCFTEYKYPKN